MFPRTREAIASVRQHAYWADPKWGDSDDAPRQAMSHVYDALVHAAQLLALRQATPVGSTTRVLGPSGKPTRASCSVSTSLFCEVADKVELRGWDVLKSLRELVEDIYCNGFVAPLALSWGRHAEKLVAGDWRIDGADRQARFFNAHVAPHIDKGPIAVSS